MERNEKKARVYQKTGDRVNMVLKENGNISQRELKRRLLGLPAGTEVDSGDICAICGGYKKLTEDMAQRIIDLFPDRNYEISWLLGLSDHKTAGAAFTARWNEITQPNRDRRTVHAAVAAMMAVHGLSWDGDSTAHLQPDETGPTVYQGMRLGTVPGKSPVISYNGVDFETWELAAIADEVFDFLVMRLDYAARTKKQQTMDVIDRQPVSISFGKKSNS